MANLIVKLFKLFRYLIAMGMGLLILYIFKLFTESLEGGRLAFEYILFGTNCSPLIHVAFIMIAFNVLIMFLFSPRGSTVWLGVYLAIWNLYLAGLGFMMKDLAEPKWAEIYEKMTQLSEINLYISIGLILVCGFLEFKSRFRMGWRYF